jgi:predicted TIM-barrel fold metal-dependent hydrolase
MVTQTVKSNPVGVVDRRLWICRLINAVFLSTLTVLSVTSARVSAQQRETNGEPKETQAVENAGHSSEKPETGIDANLPLKDFRPHSMLMVEREDVPHAKFPAIDLHTHFFYRLRHEQAGLDAFVQVMNRNQIAMCVSLDGKLGDQFTEHWNYLLKKYPDRFAIFVNIDWQGTGQDDRPETWACQRQDFVRHTVEQLAEARQMGACGLKIFKQFGLNYKNADGTLIKIDDERWDPIWQACAELKMPVIIHTADPAAFFLPIDATNERYEELSRHPDWSFYGDAFPSREDLLSARNRVIARHPQTQFIAAHVANNAEDLKTVATWLETYPNMSIGIASRISELGRQPYTARKFFLKYADRILFTTDGPWPEQRLQCYWQFLETYNEYIPYSEKEFPPQGFWQIYGIGLPDEVLRKLYYANALKMIPELQQQYDRAVQQLHTAAQSK